MRCAAGPLPGVARGSHASGRLDAVFADDEHGVALVVLTARGGGSIFEVNEAHVFHLRDGKVVEFWNASTDMYAYDEFIGCPAERCRAVWPVEISSESLTMTCTRRYAGMHGRPSVLAPVVTSLPNCLIHEYRQVA